MLFALLVFLSAFLIEGIGTYVSVIGLSSLFAANPIIITLAVALDLGKVVAVSFVYKYWAKINWIMKSYMTIASVVLMLITSAGVFGFLSGEFQKAISSTNTSSVMMTSLTDEQGRLQKRKLEIDKQVAQLPENNVRGRTTLLRQFGPEIKRINDRLIEIDKELPKLKVESIKKNVEVGPIIYVAEAFSTTPEQAVKWVILTIIFVFDPLAIALLLAGNFLIEQRKTLPKSPATDNFVAPIMVEDEILPEVNSLDETLSTFIPDEHGGEFPINEKEPEKELIAQAEVIPVDVVPQVSSDDPVIVEQPIIEEPVREIIKLEQVRPPPPPPMSRSSLEDIDPKRGDVEMDGTDVRNSQVRHLRDLYTNEILDPVTVGKIR